MYKKVLLFAGTTEGRQLCEYLMELKIESVVYVATEYGVAKLSGLSLKERANAMISIAHPAFRDELSQYANETFR